MLVLLVAMHSKLSLAKDCKPQVSQADLHTNSLRPMVDGLLPISDLSFNKTQTGVNDLTAVACPIRIWGEGFDRHEGASYGNYRSDPGLLRGVHPSHW